MTLRLSWGNNNPTADSVKIYRAYAPFAENALPAEIATLAGNAATYDDTTVTRNVIAYYRAKITKGADEHISPLMTIGHFPNSGPGPQTLLRGNWTLGYFGRVPVTNLWTIAQFRTATGTTGLTAGGAESTLTFWHKFVRNGKILFIPSAPMAGQIVNIFNVLYPLGLVYGTDDNGAYPATLTTPPTPVNQRKVITLGGDSFVVRLPGGVNAPANVIQPGYATNLLGSEWDDTIGRCYNYSNRGNATRMDDVQTAVPLGASMHFIDNNRSMVCRGTPTGDSANPSASASWTPFVELIPT